MSKILMHQQTKQQVSDFLSSPGHTLIIEGAAGSGKHKLSDYMAARLLDIEDDQLTKAHFLRVEPVNNTISIDVIRQAQQFMKLKTVGIKPVRRILIVESAESLTVEAQNAFLKLLEEPPTDTVIVLTSTNSSNLLPTIRSRAQHIRLKTPSQQNLTDFFVAQGHKPAEIQRAFYLSDGQIGLMQTLLNDKSDDNQLIEDINLAKQILVMTRFERLTQIDSLIKQRNKLSQLLKAFEILCHAGLTQASEKDDTVLVKRWHRSLGSVIQAQSTLPNNPNLKLLMSDLLLNL